MVGKRGKGHEERDVLSESGEGNRAGTDRLKTTGANVKGQRPTESGGNDDSGEDGAEQVKARSGKGQWRGGRESSSHPRSLLSRGHLAIQGS